MTEQENKPVTLWTNDAHLSDRDQFAIGLAEWIVKENWEYYQSDLIWIKDGGYMNGKETKELLDLYKQSLTKTDKA